MRVDIGDRRSWGIFRAAGGGSDHAAGHQTHEVAGISLDLQTPREAGPRLKVPEPALEAVGGCGHFRVVMAAHLQLCCCQVLIAADKGSVFQGTGSRLIAFRTVNSLRMAATRATFPGLPFAHGRV